MVIEALIDDARRDNAFGLLMSLNMLIEFGDAFEYSGSDFAGLVSRGGFRRLRDHSADGPVERCGRLQIDWEMRPSRAAIGVYAFECAMDELSYALGIDPLELRLSNGEGLEVPVIARPRV